MKIKSLIASNFKGHDMAFEFENVTVIVGPNYSGKTAVLTGLRLGLTGFLPPPLGKLPSNIYKLAGNPEAEGKMELVLTTDNDRQIKHKWTRDAKGKFSTEGGVPADLVMPALLCEPRTFFSMTAAERVRTIFGACDISKSGFGPDLLKGKLSNVQFTPVKVNETAIVLVENAIADCFRSTTTIQDVTNKLLAWLKGMGQTAKQDADRASGSFAAFRTKVAQGRPVDVSGEITTLAAAMQGAGTSNAVERSKAQTRVDNALAKLHDEYGFIEFVNGPALWLDKHRKDLDKAKKDLETEKAKKLVDTVKLEKELETNLRELDSSIEAQKSFATVIDSAKDMQMLVRKLKLCPKCKKAMDSNFQEQIESSEKSAKDLGKKIAGLNSKTATLQNSLTANQEANDQREGAISLLEQRIERLESELAKLNGAMDEYSTALKALEALPAVVDNSADRAKLADLNAKQDLFKVHQNDVKRRDELEQELLAKQCEESVYKEVTKIVVAEQEKVMTFAFNQVLTTARAFTDGLLNSPLEFYNGELGRRISQADQQAGNKAELGSWVSHETLSGVEQALAYIGFSIALVKDAPIKLVMIDDVVIKLDLKMKIIRRFVELVKNQTIHQAFFADASDDWNNAGNIEGVQIINLNVPLS